LNIELDKLLSLLIIDPTYRLIYYLNDSSDDIKIINQKFDNLLQLKQRKLHDEMLGIKTQTDIVKFTKPIDESKPKSDQVMKPAELELRSQQILDDAFDVLFQLKQPQLHDESEPKSDQVMKPAEDGLSEAELRRKKILDNADKRMIKVMGKGVMGKGGMYKNKSKKKIINNKFSKKKYTQFIN
jgi:hypothetical protein